MNEKPLAPYEPTEQNEQDLTRLVLIATSIIGHHEPDQLSRFFPESEEQKLADQASKVLAALKATMRKERKHTPDPTFWVEYLQSKGEDYTPYDFTSDEARDGYVPWYRQQDHMQLELRRLENEGRHA